jgi:phosphoglycolate phosphatase
VLVGGDTLAHRKPHPEPLLHACRALSLLPDQVIYVGDDLRDIESARAAGIVSIAALWGYREPGDDPARWGADHCLAQARDLLALPGLLTP